MRLVSPFSIIVFFILAGSLGIFTGVEAAEEDNMLGFAWSETFGWIIFNSDARERDGQLLDFGIPVGLSSDDAHDDGPASCFPNYSHTDPEVIAGAVGCGVFYTGFRWADLDIPSAATLISAAAKLRYATFASQPDTLIAFQDSQTPATFSSSDSPFHRWTTNQLTPTRTFDLVAQSGFVDPPPATWISTPDLTSDLQGVIDLDTTYSVQEVLLLESGSIAPSGESFFWTAYDDTNPDRYGAARLYVEYMSGGTNYDFIFDSPSGEDFGVQIDPATGNFTTTNENGKGAYAWSSNIGWIKFDPSTSPPAFYEQHAARMNVDGSSVCGGTQNDICGWARACAAVANKTTCEGTEDPNAGGWDGWIYLGAISGFAGSGLTYDDVNETVDGWAWGGDIANGEGIGWISFNDYTGPNIDPGGLIADTAFLSLNVPPQAVNLSFDHFGGTANCGLGYSPMVAQWDFYDANFGDEPASFQVVARNTNSGECVLAINHANSCTSAPARVGSTCEPTNTDIPVGGTCDGDFQNPVNPCEVNPRPLSTATGTGAITNGSLVVTGIGTLFQTEVEVGDRITVGLGVEETRTVVSVASDTSLTVNTAFTDTRSGEEIRLNVPRFINCSWVVDNPSASHPAFFSTYYWAVRVEDNDENEPAWSVWAGVDSAGDGTESFETRRHRYPGPSGAFPINPEFTMIPTEPSVGEVIEFTENANCFWTIHAGSINNPYSCTETAFENFGGSASALDHRYQWDLTGDGDFDDAEDCDSDVDPDCRDLMPITHTYDSIRLDVEVTLRVTDEYIENTYDTDGGYCNFTHDVFDVFPRTIQWKEITPF